MKKIDHNAHSVYLMYYHLIMVVKYRRKVIDNPISERAKEIWEHIAPRYGIVLEEWNHDIDHVHVMFRAQPRTELSKFINAYKSASSRLLKKEYPEIREKVLNIAYRFRIYPTEEQKILLGKTFGCCRFLYNQMLNDKIQEYEKTKKMLKDTPAMYKKEYPFLKEVDSLALANIQLHLEKAYKNFFSRTQDWISKVQVKASFQKQLYNECGQWKYPGGK